MRTKILTLLLLFAYTTAFSQIKYEKGYFISNDDTKTECLIYNMDWLRNPDYFYYKLSDDDITQIGNIKNVKEFMVYGYSKFLRSEVKIDQSSSNSEHLDYNRNPNYETWTIFLKVLVEGDASLYSFNNTEISRFFFKVNDSTIQQLVYKNYYVIDPENPNNSSKIATNNYYQQQLFNEVNCRNLSITEIASIGYNLKSLNNYFTKNNECLGDTQIVYEGFKYAKTDTSNVSENIYKRFSIRLRPGINYPTLSVTDLQFDINYNFKNVLGYSLGLEFEYYLPVLKNKFSLILEPNFQYLKGTLQDYSYTPYYYSWAIVENDFGYYVYYYPVSTETFVHRDLNLNYYSIEIPFGFRFYSYINNNVRVFLNFSIVMDFDLNSILRDGDTKLMKVDANPVFSPGIGFEYSKYSIEFRYYTKQDLFKNQDSWISSYNNCSLILGYCF